MGGTGNIRGRSDLTPLTVIISVVCIAYENIYTKVQEGNDQEKAQSEIPSPKKRGGKNLN